MASGSGLTLLDPEAAFANTSRRHAGETLTVITQDGPPIASAVAAAAAPFKKLTGATVIKNMPDNCEPAGSITGCSS